MKYLQWTAICAGSLIWVVLFGSIAFTGIDILRIMSQ